MHFIQCNGAPSVYTEQASEKEIHPVDIEPRNLAISCQVYTFSLYVFYNNQNLHNKKAFEKIIDFDFSKL
jgi:hypothetical protein